MSHDFDLEKNVLDADSSVEGPMTGGPAHSLAPLFLENSDLGSARFTFDDGDDLGVGDKGRAGENLAAILLDQQYLVVSQLCARLSGCSVDGRYASRRHLDLPAAGLHDCVHIRHL